MDRLRRSRTWAALRHAAAGAVFTLLAGVGTASAADFTPNPTPSAAPASRPAAGPENLDAGGARPVSGKSPAAGPQFVKKGSTWSVTLPNAVLRNTVTDADGDKSNLTFEVWTTDASGKPETQVKLTDENPYGVLVSGYVASGKTAQVTVPYGKLKPGVTYTFHTSAYDGSLYENSWSPWANFRIDHYMTFPAPQPSSTIDPVAQSVKEITRSDPGITAAARGSAPKRSCSAADSQGRRLCIEIGPPSSQAKASPRAPAVDLVGWCGGKAAGKDYMNRSEACLKSIGSATLIWANVDPNEPALGTATFDIEQRIKAYPKKGDSGSNFGEYDQQIYLAPRHIDPVLGGVTLKWNVAHNCSSCVVAQTKWADNANNTALPHWDATDWSPVNGRWGTVQTVWSGTGKETIDLGWSITGTVDVSDKVATADFGSSGVQGKRELAPRCDDILNGVAPGCVLPFFKPTYTVDTNLYPAAGAYYWLMQEKMPDHAGSKKWDSLLHYLGPDTKVTNPNNGKPWTADDSRDKVCPTSWTPPRADASVGTLDCDEYAMASTHESGGFPGGINQVPSGDQCAQLYMDKLSDDSADFGLFADTRTDKNEPSWKERCGRAGIDSSQNRKAFSKLNPSLWRLLDGDGFFVSNPGFEHCANANTACAWRKVG